MSKNINELMKELNEYNTMKEELELQIESLKDDIKGYMSENNIDEVLSDDGYKATWREVESVRIDSKNLKSKMPEIWAKFSKVSISKRFTFN